MRTVEVELNNVDTDEEEIYEKDQRNHNFRKVFNPNPT